MARGLENRVRKLEKAMEPKVSKQPPFDRELLEKLRSTPEGRAACRAQAERIIKAMQARDRERIEARHHGSGLPA
jgi:hypothetical protein